MTPRALLPLLLALALGACGSDPPAKGGASSAKAPAKAPPKPGASAASAGDAGAAEEDAGPPPPKMDFQEVEFAESDKSRDPFRSYAETFVDEARSKVKSQREVVLDQYSIEDLKLIGIVTGIVPAKAMLVDPTGKGHVVQRGQFIGRPETVQAANTTGTNYEVNWRVDRIRDGDVVLVREDPQNPDVPSATKVLPLRPEGTVVNEK
jgi:type IV pilus assembly protein PilP